MPEMLFIVMKRIYIAGPYSANNIHDGFRNMRVGMKMAVRLLSGKFAPFCPWLDYQMILMDTYNKIPPERFYEYSLQWLRVSDAMLVLPGWQNSKGTKKEIAFAENYRIPIFFKIEDLINHFK